MALVPYPYAEPGEHRHFDTKAIRRLLDCYQQEPLGSMWVVMLAGALRWCEAAGLRWSDLGWDDGIVTVRQKVARHLGHGRPGQNSGSGWRVEPYTKTPRGMRDALLIDFGWEALRYERRQAEARGEDVEGDTLIWHRADGGPHSYELAWKHWRQFSADNALPKLHLHELRHTTAMQLYALTGDLKLVQDQLGHESIMTTAKVYARGKVDIRLRAGAAAYQEAIMKVSEAVSDRG
jgi:integrase